VCVVTDGTLRKPMIVANERIEILGDAERFCYHMAAEMERAAAAKWIDGLRTKAIANARRALEPLLATGPERCVIVATERDPGELEHVLAAHPRIHTAEGCFYRDILRAACPIPVRLVPPSALDVSKVGKLAPPPWGKDQKQAALAAWG
jgi:hypothetical protein